MTTLLLAALLFPQVTPKEEIYLKEKAALEVIFGDAKILRKNITLDAATKLKVERRLGRRIGGTFTLFTGVKNGSATGYAIITEEKGKYLPITFVVGVSPKAKIIDVAVMVHREPIGGDCRKRRFLNQLKGKEVGDPIKMNRDLIEVSGATLSCKGVARGTRKVLAIVDELCLKRPTFAKSLIRQEDSRQQRYRMGTLLTITAVGEGAKRAVDDAFAEIKRIEEVITNYDENSPLSKLNREGKSDGPAGLLAFIDLSLRYAKETNGAFDFTVGAAVRAWGFRTGKHRVPSDSEIGKLVTGWKKVKRQNGSVVLDKGLELDPGAIGKGYAVDAAVALLRKRGMDEAVVDFGSTVACFGRSHKVGIRDPFDNGKILGVVTIRDEALAVSGNYEKFFEVDGRKYAHILDPRTNRPVEKTASTVVVAKTAIEADVYSTAVFVEPTLRNGRAAMVVPVDRAIKPILTESFRRRWK